MQRAYPKIPRAARCGTCENCLNPQRKKACIVVRAQQEQGLSPSISPTAPPAAAAAPSSDRLAEALARILGPAGGLAAPAHAAELVTLMCGARLMDHRIALLAVLKRSGHAAHAAAVHANVLEVLQGWLAEFASDRRSGMISKTLDALGTLPVTLVALRNLLPPPSGLVLTKAVGSLRKSADAGIAAQARALVAQWKEAVEGAPGCVPAGGASGR